MALKNGISGIICELNPPHNGHNALFDRAKSESRALVAVMSGNFVQRGEAAILDKWSRARLALDLGADLVLELPLPWALAAAERFALGGTAVLNALGCVDALWFGSECGETAALSEIAELLGSDGFSEALHPFLAAGLPFAAAREKAVETLLGTEKAALLRESNNILGVEYLKAIRTLGAKLAPRTMRRIGVSHDGGAPSGDFASASYLRTAENIAPYVPNAVAERIEALKKAGQYPARLEYLERAILAHLSTAEPDALRSVPDVSEGLENRLKEAARTAQTLSELYDGAKSKRYSHARIRRIALASYLGITDDLPPLPPYLHVLGMTDRGAEILGSASPTLPLVARPADVKTLSAEAQRIFALEARVDDIYALCTARRRPAGMTYTEKLIRI